MTAVAPDRLRTLLDTLVGALDADVDGAGMARRALLSRFHFDRLVADAVGEPPGTLRRRLLLERAAWRLGRGAGVTAAGFEAGYGSTAAFSRAFRRAYGVAPSRFAASGADFRLAAGNGLHFHPPAGLRLPSATRRPPMDLTDRLLEHDVWLTGRLLERAAELPDAALDRELRPGHEVLRFDGPEATVRQMLDRLVWTKEVWSAAIAGRDLPDALDDSIPGLRARWARAGSEFVALVREVRERGGWDAGFVDALCDPPQSFTLGGVVAHVITFSAHRRQVLIAALADLGVIGIDHDPLEWERQRMVERPLRPAALRGTDR